MPVSTRPCSCAFRDNTGPPSTPNYRSAEKHDLKPSRYSEVNPRQEMKRQQSRFCEIPLCGRFEQVALRRRLWAEMSHRSSRYFW